ncbi:MAG: reverse transcriptase-like protein [Lachnospiraceae bacterium]|nr:reverse transcriptase-like protein [Lachnospiraceae bacterium]
MAGKYYVVRNGRKNGIYRSWEECKAQVDGFKGASYKSFKTEKEAISFFSEGMAGSQESRDNVVKAYVDGSFYNGEYSYGVVILRDGKETCFSGKDNDTSLASMHNVAGEIKGAEAAMRYAVEEGLGEIIIYHDYEGIAKWCLGEWKTNKEGTKAYKEYYNSLKDKVHIRFVKVKGHSNDKYNDMADMLAKKALGLI